MRKQVAVVVVGLVVLGGGGAAIAASGSGPSPSGFLDSVANHLGISREELDDATRAAALDQVDSALEAGHITEEQADAMRERIESGEAPPLFGRPFLHDHEEFGFGPPGGPVGAVSLDEAADYLGLGEDALHERLRDGDTLAEVAEDEGKSVDGLVDTLVAAAKERLDAAVESGDLTGERRDEILERVEAGVRRFVEEAFRLHRFGHGPGADRPDLGPAPEAALTL